MRYLRERAQLFSAMTKMLFRANGLMEKRKPSKSQPKRKLQPKEKKKLDVIGFITKKNPE